MDSKQGGISGAGRGVFRLTGFETSFAGAEAAGALME